MDPWFESRIRLADRKGLLTGRRLSLVQDYATELVMLLEAKDRGVEYVDSVRLALVSSDPAKWLPTVFPTKEVEEVSEADDLEDTTGEWSFAEPVSKEAAEAMLAETVAATKDGELGFDDLDLSGLTDDLPSEEEAGWV